MAEQLKNKSINFSPYLNRLVIAEPDFFNKIQLDGYDKAFAELMRSAFEGLYLTATPDIATVELRILKRRAALLIAMADLNQAWSLTKITQALTVLAEASVRIAIASLLRQAAEKGNWRIDDPKKPEENSGLIVLAMGKLGARELNYSSDIDLIVLYDSDKNAYTGKREPSAFFVKLTRDLIAMMEEKTNKGYVFRTDLRLRPDPGSTPVALSTAAAACYYESFAQNWERAAFIKARPLAGDKKAGRAFLKEIKPFIWRRSTDFYALNQIHDIKRSLGARVAQENQGLAGYNVKLGNGGIREIEFFTQLQQLLWGGRDAHLRSRKTLTALKQLVKAGWVKPDLADQLAQAYEFLRTLEHRLQMVEDEQTQTLPKTTEGLEYIAQFMGMDYPSFESRVCAYREIVSTAYDSLFANETEHDDLSFSGADLPEFTANKLTEMGFCDLDFIADCVRGWLSGRYRSVRSEKARALVSELISPIFTSLSQSANPDAAFIRFDEFLKGLPAGVQLFSLFQSRPALLDLLAEVLGFSPVFSSELARHSELFDAVLSRKFFEPFPNLATLSAEAHEVMENAEDVGQAMDIARRFVREKRFRAATLFMRGLIAPTDLGGILADLVDAVINALCPIVLADFEKTNGKMPNGAFSFIVMGKAGSREMSFSSDLDILFLYDAPDGAMSEGSKALSPSVYYARLAQRFINALTLNTKEGILWPVDMRLRPSGNAGPVAVSLSAFKKYYADQAWTWELMALTKARVIWGSIGTTEINGILSQKRDSDKITADVSQMREKIAEQFPAKSVWDIKYCKGGMVDIEFFVQREKLLNPQKDNGNVCAYLTQMQTGKAEKLKQAYQFWTTLSALFSVCLTTQQTPEQAPIAVQRKIAEFCQCATLEQVAEKICSTAHQVYSEI